MSSGVPPVPHWRNPEAPRVDKVMRQRLLSILAVVGMTAFLAGCPVDLDTEDYPTVRPREADLIGTYRPNPETKQYIEQVGKYPAADISIVLAADGKATITNIPDWWRDGSAKPHGQFDTGEGSWRVVQSQQWWELMLDSASTSGSASHATGWGVQVNLVGHHAPYIIRVCLGDPDSGHWTSLEKSTLSKLYTKAALTPTLSRGERGIKRTREVSLASVLWRERRFRQGDGFGQGGGLVHRFLVLGVGVAVGDDAGSDLDVHDPRRLTPSPLGRGLG